MGQRSKCAYLRNRCREQYKRKDWKYGTADFICGTSAGVLYGKTCSGGCQPDPVAGADPGIVGESGSGKSTLIRAAMGLLGSDGAVTGGSIRYKDKNVTGLKGEELRKLRGPQMGMVFQNTGASLCPIRTIGDQLYEAVLQHEKVSRQEIKERAMDLFDKMKLADGERILNSYPFELSGGMNQRVGIMMAMILHPDLLFADEPTSALDVTVQAQVVREMMKMRELFGTTIAIVHP